ncbi:MAG: hypothetical protein WKF75_14855 [Singulisphaera sp.]
MPGLSVASSACWSCPRGGPTGEAPGRRFWTTTSRKRCRASGLISARLTATWVAQLGYASTSRPIRETNQPASRTWSSRRFSSSGRNGRETAFQPFESTLTNASTSCWTQCSPLAWR